jgi:hypothetical protein
LAKENLTTQEVNKLFLATDNRGGTVFHAAAQFGILKKFQGIFNLAKENLTTEEVNKLFLATDKKGRTVFHVAVTSRKLEVVQGIFNLAKENLTTEELNKLFLATNNQEGRSFMWQHSLGNYRYFRDYLIWVKRI